MAGALLLAVDWCANPEQDDAVSINLGSGSAIRFVWVPVVSVSAVAEVEIGDFTGAQVKEPVRMEPVSGPFTGKGGVRGYYLGATEVTRDQWGAVMGDGERGGEPAVAKAVPEIQTFIERLNERVVGLESFPQTPDGTLGVVRLPTEAEWEYGARGGAGPDYQAADPYGGDLERHEVFASAGSGGTSRPSGARQPNSLGLHDMLGNVRELVEGSYVVGGMVGGLTLRGGSYLSERAAMRSSARTEQMRKGADGKSARRPDAGFRLCISAEVFTSLGQAQEVVKNIKESKGAVGGASPVKAPKSRELQEGPKQSADASADWRTFVASIKLAASQSNPDAQGIYSYMIQLRPNLGERSQAVSLATASANKRSAYGLFALARLYESGQGVPKSTEKATDLFRESFPEIERLASKGDLFAQYVLAGFYGMGRFVAKDDSLAIKWSREPAERGLPLAQVFLGSMYEQGRGVAKDEAEAVRWYREAAEQGDAGGQYFLGSTYEYGKGVARDEAEAVNWYRKAADQGNAHAQCNLGMMYADGNGVAQDDAEAVKWYRKAAELGNAGGQNNLGYMYGNGKGVAQDDTEAAKWYRKAAEQGYAYGQFNLGVMYEERTGVARDEEEAVKWYRKAAEQGIAAGQAGVQRILNRR